MLEKTKIGVLGVGAISKAYIPNIINKFSFALEIVAIADLNSELALQRADEFGLAAEIVCTPEEMLANDEISIILNLTNIAVHYDVIRSILMAGKHCYSEKPLSLDRKQAKDIIKLAAEKNLRIGCAPDCFLGAAHQTERKVLDDGYIGKPVFANAVIHMSMEYPPYLTSKYGAAQFDMGPYFVTALVNMLGPAKKVTGFSKIPFPKRMVENTTNVCFGSECVPDVPTLVSGIIEFESGVLATMTTLNDSHDYIPKLEVTGNQGTLVCADPNYFGGDVKIYTKYDQEPNMVPFFHDYNDEARGLGLADMAYAIKQNRAHRASGELALHVVDILQGLAESNGNAIEMTTTCERPKALRTGKGICSIYEKEDE